VEGVGAKKASQDVPRARCWWIQPAMYVCECGEYAAVPLNHVYRPPSAGHRSSAAQSPGYVAQRRWRASAREVRCVVKRRHSGSGGLRGRAVNDILKMPCARMRRQARQGPSNPPMRVAAWCCRASLQQRAMAFRNNGRRVERAVVRCPGAPVMRRRVVPPASRGTSQSPA